jgi:hybrid cluster-associated redox disulfide protein
MRICEGGVSAVTINKDMNIQEVVAKYPELVPVFFKYGLGCIGCAAARYESIEQGAMAHGINVPALIEDLNKALAAK